MPSIPSNLDGEEDFVKHLVSDDEETCHGNSDSSASNATREGQGSEESSEGSVQHTPEHMTRKHSDDIVENHKDLTNV